MFRDRGEINIKRLQVDWAVPPGEAARRSARALLHTYEGSDLCDGGGKAQSPLWRWFAGGQVSIAAPVHPAECQFAYIQALIALSTGDPKATLELLKKGELFDSVRKLWRWSDGAPNERSFEARTQLAYARLLCTLGAKADAAEFLRALRRSELYDAASMRWPHFVRGADSPPVLVYFAGDQLAYINALIDVEERGEASARLDQLLASSLFNGGLWVSCVDSGGQIIDPRRRASDQLEYVSILARLRSSDAAREFLGELMMSKLHDGGQWRSWIGGQGALATDERRTCDQLRYVQALVAMSDRTGAETALERLKNDFWIGDKKQWRASFNKRAAISSPVRLALDQLGYVALLGALAPEDTFAAQRELPVMRDF